jgi:hypothetical protein
VEKVSQNDLSFLAILIIPTLIDALRRSVVRITPGLYLALFLLFAALLNFTFLQKAAYALLLSGLYAIWLSVSYRTWRPVVLGLTTGIPALVLSFPRLVTVGNDFADGNRTAGAIKGISELYNGSGFSRLEILRWFDERIFGATFEKVSALGQSINLHEGFLLYLTSFAPFLLIYLLFKRIPFKRHDRDAQFFLYFTMLCFFFVFSATGYWLLWMMFMRVDFIHFRVLVVAMLPCCALLALVIDDLRDRAAHQADSLPRSRPIVAIVAAASFAIVVEAVATFLSVRGISFPTGAGSRFDGGASFRIAFSALALGFIGWNLHKNRYTRDLAVVVATLLVVQTTSYATMTVWGPGRWPVPAAFASPTRLMAHPGDYRTPSDNAVNDVRQRLEADSYRTAFICPPSQVAVFCSPQIANFWHLRGLDGYVSTVPQRLASLPLGPPTGTRTIHFSTVGEINWPVMGLFNVKHALTFRPELFTNAVRQPGQPVRELSASDLSIVDNPGSVTPRLFFARSVVARTDMQSAIDYLFPKGTANHGPYHPEEVSVVEGIAADRSFSTDGSAAARFAGDTITIELSPSTQERFLVLNERYESNWIATDETGKLLPILPTNVAMRGVVLPPNIRQVVFAYNPFAFRKAAMPFYLIGFMLAAACFMLIEWRRRKTTPVTLAS